MDRRPMVVIFDVIETLVSLASVEARLSEVGFGGEALRLWFPALLRDGFALAASGTHKPFPAVAERSLRVVARQAGVDLDVDAVRHVLDGFTELAPHPDAEPALQRLRSEGVRVMTLSNGGADTTRSLLERAGLLEMIELTVSVDQAGFWKPRPEPYLLACRTARVDPGAAALVAVHAWDVHGAARAGLLTGWCARLEGTFDPGVFDPPTVRGDTLVDVVEGLLEFDGSAEQMPE